MSINIFNCKIVGWSFEMIKSYVDENYRWQWMMKKSIKFFIFLCMRLTLSKTGSLISDKIT